MKMDALSHPNPVLVLVEDDTDTEALVVRMLAKKGIEEIAVLRDGQDAVDWFQHSAARPCLVLLDMKLPRIDGLGVLRQIRNLPSAKEAAIVMFSSVGSIEVVTRARSLGADDFAVKPVDNTRLQDIIVCVVEKYITPASVG